MKPVIQEDVTGCAIACAAVLTGLSYRGAKRVAARLGIDVTEPALWSVTRPMRHLLRELGVTVSSGETPFTGWAALPDRALLAVKWRLERGRPHWHWVLFVRDGEREYVLDSKRSLRHHVRTDFGRIRPRWFIAIERIPDSTIK